MLGPRYSVAVTGGGLGLQGLTLLANVKQERELKLRRPNHQLSKSPEVSNTKETSGCSLAWLAMRLSKIAVSEVDVLAIKSSSFVILNPTLLKFLN